MECHLSIVKPIFVNDSLDIENQHDGRPELPRMYYSENSLHVYLDLSTPANRIQSCCLLVDWMYSGSDYFFELGTFSWFRKWFVWVQDRGFMRDTLPVFTNNSGLFFAQLAVRPM